MIQNNLLWETEPNYLTFNHKGYECICRRTAFGHWCGYIRIPKDHPLYGKDYFKDEIAAIDIHGGITWADNKLPDDEKDNPNYWFIGFDCAHLNDYSPNRSFNFNEGTYRPLGYVIYNLTQAIDSF